VRRLLVLAALLAAALAAALPAAAGAPRFGAYVSCGLRADDADRRCSLGATPAAVFRAFARSGVEYKVCVRRPGGRAHCRRRETGRRGARSRAAIGLTRPGRYSVSWFVGRRRIDRERFRARAPRVFVNGDSLAVGTRPYMPRALPGWPLTQSTSISRHAPEGVDVLRRKRNLARIVVMSLGTNDDPRATDDFARSVRQTVGIAGRRGCVVWPNIVRPPVGGRSYAGYNAILARLNRRFETLLVVDWAAMVRRNRHWMASDGVHPDASGYRARARAIAAKARRCIA
jgi:hypothetical protein